MNLRKGFNTSHRVQGSAYAPGRIAMPSLGSRPSQRSGQRIEYQPHTCPRPNSFSSTRLPSGLAAHNSQVTETMVPADITQTWAFLKEFTVKMFRGLGASYVATPEKRKQLRDGLLLVYSNPWPSAGWVPPKTAPTIQSSHSAQGPSTSTNQAADATSVNTSISSDASSNTDNQDTETGSLPLVMIGLMAGDIRIGARAMRDYCQALGLPYSKPESRVPGVESVASITGSVYMKYNSQNGICYVSQYFGKDRGILVQLGTEQLGHFPLGLFDEEMKAPPPVL